MARKVADIKSENLDLRKLLQSRQRVVGFNNNVGESRHSVFEKHVALPLKIMDDFKHFEEELLKVEVRSNLVICYMDFDDFQQFVDCDISFFRSRFSAVFLK